MREIPQQTLAAAVNGDINAFEDIYRAASSFVYTLAYRVLNNSQDAQEVTQDVFVKVHRYLKDFAFKSSLKTWLYRITMNTAITLYRRRSRERVRTVDYDTVIATVPASETTEKVADQASDEAVVSSLLEALNPDQRACIVLRELEGLGYREIAQALNININTVRSRLKRAREALVAHAQKRGDLHEL